jgi:AcrR family transcriptional regulator
VTTAPLTAGVTRRERARAATLAEIKRTALDLMREQGTTDVRFTDIARQMGMTPPALYRYYADRDELLTELITDAYDDLGREVAKARDAAPPGDVWRAWVAVAAAYRDWARREPQQFALILGMPVPGYAAPDEGPTTEAAKRAMGQLAELFLTAARAGALRRPLLETATPAMAACAAEKHPELEGVLPPETFQAMIHAWAALHGITSLEAYGHLDWMGPEAKDALFVSELEITARVAGMPTRPEHTDLSPASRTD